MKLRLLFPALFIICSNLAAQTYSNGLTEAGGHIKLGGTLDTHTTVLGKIGIARYKLIIDTLALFRANATRLDLEGDDSIRMASNSLIKLLSDGDINIGAANNVVMSGNVWLKNYLNSATNPGILTVDTCGRLILSNTLTPNNIFKQGGNSFGTYGWLGTNDSNNLHLVTKGIIRQTIAANGISYNYGGLQVDKGSASVKLNVTENISSFGTVRNYFGGSAFLTVDHTGNEVIGGENITHYTWNQKTQAGRNHFSFKGQQIDITSGLNNIVTINRQYYPGPDSSTAEINLLNIDPFIYFANRITPGRIRGMYINPGVHYAAGYTASVTDRFTALETTRGSVLFNTARGSTGIGVSAVHPSAKLEIASVEKGFLLPRMTRCERDAIASPAKGLIVYNNTDSTLELFNGATWVKLVAAASASCAMGGNSNHGSQGAAENLRTAKIKKSHVEYIGDCRGKSFRVNHNLNSKYVSVQFIDCGPDGAGSRLINIPEGVIVEMDSDNALSISFDGTVEKNQYKVIVQKVEISEEHALTT